MLNKFLLTDLPNELILNISKFTNIDKLLLTCKKFQSYLKDFNILKVIYGKRGLFKAIQFKVEEHIIEKFIDINNVEYYSEQAANYSLEINNPRLLSKLINKNFDFHKFMTDACNKGKIDIVKLLLNYKDKNYDYKKLFNLAIKNGHLDIVKLFLDNKYIENLDDFLRNYEENDFLEWNINVIKYLCDHSQYFLDKITNISYIVINGKYNLLKYLLDNEKSKINIKLFNDLDMKILCKTNIQTLEVLINYKLKYNINNLIIFALEDNYIDIALYIINKENINITDNKKIFNLLKKYNYNDNIFKLLIDKNLIELTSYLYKNDDINKMKLILDNYSVQVDIKILLKNAINNNNYKSIKFIIDKYKLKNINIKYNIKIEYNYDLFILLLDNFKNKPIYITLNGSLFFDVKKLTFMLNNKICMFRNINKEIDYIIKSDNDNIDIIELLFNERAKIIYNNEISYNNLFQISLDKKKINSAKYIYSKFKSEINYDIIDYNCGVNFLLRLDFDINIIIYKILFSAKFSEFEIFNDYNYGYDKDELLILVCKYENLDIIKYLVDIGADVNAKNGAPLLSLFSTISDKKFKINIFNKKRNYLYKKGADINIIKEEILNKYYNDINKSIFNHLMNYNFSRNFLNMLLATIIKSKETRNNLDLKLYKIISLISKGIDINYNNGEFLFNAIYINNKHIVKILLNNNANCDINNGKPLLTSIKYNRLEIMNILIDRGANPNINMGKPLLFAIKNNKLNIIRNLLIKGANPNIDNGKSLSMAIHTNNFQVIKILFEFGINKNNPRFLKEALVKNNNDIILYLISNGMKINNNDNDLLNIAINNNNVNIVDILLNYDFIISSEILINVVLICNLDILSLLVKKNYNLINNLLILSIKYNNLIYVDYLLNNGANIDFNNYLPIKEAINNYDIIIINKIIKKYIYMSDIVNKIIIDNMNTIKSKINLNNIDHMVILYYIDNINSNDIIEIEKVEHQIKVLDNNTDLMKLIKLIKLLFNLKYN